MSIEKMLESQRIHLRLFLEGIEVPVISASVSASIGSAATATIQIPGHDSSLYILPKTMVHVFFYDWEDDHLSGTGVGPYTEGVGAPLLTPQVTKDGNPTEETLRDLKYKLLFVGEVISMNFAKDGFGSQTVTLACSDCSSSLDSAYLFQTQYHSSTAGLINQDGGFYGSNGNPFDDMISTPERVVADFIRQNKPKNPALRGNKKTIVGGLFALFEVLLGVHGYSYGLDTFFTVQERRLRLMEQIVSDTGTVASELFDAQVFQNWVQNKLGGTPAVMSFREVSQMIMNYVFYQQVPNPVGFYQWGGRSVPEYSDDSAGVFEEMFDSFGSSQAANRFLKLDAKFAEAAIEVLREVDKRAIRVDLITGETSVGLEGSTGSSSTEEGAEDYGPEFKSISPTSFFSATFRDYQKRAEVSDITVEKAKATAHTKAHDVGLAVDISSGIGRGWSIPDELSYVKDSGAAEWSFLGVTGKDLDYWRPKAKTNGFAALMLVVKLNESGFSDPEEMELHIQTKIDDYQAYLDGMDEAEFVSTLTDSEGNVTTDPLAVRKLIDADGAYEEIDFWIKCASVAWGKIPYASDPDSDMDYTTTLYDCVKVTFLVAQEQQLWWTLLGEAIAAVNKGGKFDKLSWGGSWTGKSDVMQLLSSLGKVGWDPCHVQSKRFDSSKLLRDPEILNNSWESRDKDAKNYTPSVADIIEASNEIDEADLEGESKIPIKKLYQTGYKSKSGRERLLTQIYRPDVWFCPPPMCNNIFPEEYSSLTFSRPMMREVTRLKLTSYNQLMEDVVVNKYYFAPQFEGIANLEEKGIGEVANVVLYPHEIYTGIIPKIQKLNEASFYTKAAAEIQTDVGDLNEKVNYASGETPEAEASAKFTSLLETYGARVAHFHLLTARFASRSGSVMGRFMPRIVPGFPAAIYQKSYDGRAAITTALSAGLSEYFGSNKTTKALSREIFNKTKPVHYQCMVQSVTHTISQQQANTSISFTHARSHKTDSATDDLLSVMASKGSFKVTSDAAGAAAKDKVFETLSISGDAVYTSATAFFEICKQFYTDLFHQDHSSVVLAMVDDTRYSIRPKILNAETYDAKIVVKEITPKVNAAKRIGGPTGKAIPKSMILQIMGANTGGEDFHYIYKPRYKAGEAADYSETGITYTLSKIQYPGTETGILYEAPPGTSEYAIGPDAKSLFTLEVTGSFEKKLPWETSMFIRVPITNSHPLVQDNLSYTLGQTPPQLVKGYSSDGYVFKNIFIDIYPLFSEEGAAIVTGIVNSSTWQEVVGHDTVVYYEHVRNLDTGGWEGYLYVKILPRFTSLKVFYGTIDAAADTATSSNVKEPWEVAIRPGWFSTQSYSNTNIGKTYKGMFGCDSVTTYYNLTPLPGYSTVSTEQAMDRIIAEYQSTTDRILWIHRNCSRGDANLIEVLGSKEPDKIDEFDSGGFHSAAVGNYANLECLDLANKNLGSLLDPSLQKVQINAGENKIDPRQSRRNAILYYLSTILTRGIRS